MTGDEGNDGAYYSVIVVPEGIYNILSGIEGDTMGDSKKTGSEEQAPLGGAGLNLHYLDKAIMPRYDWG